MIRTSARRSCSVALKIFPMFVGLKPPKFWTRLQQSQKITAPGHLRRAVLSAGGRIRVAPPSHSQSCTFCGLPGLRFVTFLGSSIQCRLRNHRRRCPPLPSRRCNTSRTLSGACVQLYGPGGGAISDFLPFKPISRQTSSGRGASSGGQPGPSSGSRSVGKLNFRSAASATVSTETFSRCRVAPKDSARSLSGFDSPKRRNLSCSSASAPLA